MKGLITRILRLRKVLIRRDYYQSRQVSRERITFGNRFADWTFCPDGINSSSIVYSFGVGEDISFDLELIDQYQLHVHAFDPSPGSGKWIREQELPENLHFYPYGLADTDGSISFSEPDDPGVKSLRLTNHIQQNEPQAKQIDLPVHKLKTIILELGHSKIDILKMDIEGSEYSIIEDIIACSVEISQILIEFHHRFKNYGISDTRRAISLLISAGYKIFNVSASGEEISLIKI